MLKGSGACCVSALIMAWVAASSAKAQDEIDPSLRPDFAWPPVQDESRSVRFSLIVDGRLSVIFGHANSDFNANYRELFGAGVGLQGETSLLFRSGDWLVGGYGALGFETFNGQTVKDGTGATLKPDGMDIVTVLAGIKGDYFFAEGLYSELNVGFGVAKYDDVDGTLKVGGVPKDVNILKATTAFALDLGYKVGYEFGPFVAEGGLGFRVMGAPESGDLGLDFHGPVEAAVEVGIGLKF